MAFLDELSDSARLHAAWEDVRARRGSAGIDRVTIDAFADGADGALQELAVEIRCGSWRPLPVLRIRPSFLVASDRALVIPTVRDRIVQRAVADLLDPQVDPVLSPACCAFRKGRSATSAADRVGRWAAEGFPWVLRSDIRHFFDTIRPEVLEEKLARFVDPPGLSFLRRLVRCRVFDGHAGGITEPVTGIAQGSPLSPLLANLYLAEVDHAMYAASARYLRYCDDILVMEHSEEDANAALGRLRELLVPLGLEINKEKTRVARVEDGIVFLGYHFGPQGRGPAAKAVEALRFRLSEMADDAAADSLDALWRGWTQYYGTAPEPWLSDAVGILALVRHREGLSDDTVERAVTARLRLGKAPPLPLAEALAAAWIDAGEPAMGWFELALSAGPGQPAEATKAWAALLGTETGPVESLSRRLAGDAQERLAETADFAASTERFEVASRLASLRTSLEALPIEVTQTSRAEPAQAADVPLLLDFFQGRDGVHAVEWVRAGQRSFVPNQRPIREEDWRAHLAGERTLGLALVRADQTVLLAVFDIDIGRRDLDLRRGVPDALMGRALATALRLRTQLKRSGVASLLEDSGRKGYHVWVRLSEPTRAAVVRRWMHAEVARLEALPEGIRIECFPDRDRVPPESNGPIIKLPLGVHSQTGRRCELLDEHGRPLSDPFEALRTLPRVVASVFETAPEPIPESRLPAPVPPPVPAARVPVLLEKCGVLRQLVERADKTLYLTHLERTALLCTLGHLGDEGRQALHDIISKCHNYRRETTDRYIAKMPPSPISCARLREQHPQITATAGCSCTFRLRGRAYPSPVLHVLKPTDVPGFRERRPQGKTPPAPPQGTGKAVAVTEPKSELVPAAKASLVPKAMKTEATVLETRPMALPSVVLDEEARGKVEMILQRVADFKRQMRTVRDAMEEARSQLGAVFEQMGAEAIELALGTLTRTRRPDGEGWDYHLEV